MAIGANARAPSGSGALPAAHENEPSASASIRCVCETVPSAPVSVILISWLEG